MDFITNILAPLQWPTGFWESIIKWFAGVGSIGVGIILLTLCLKLVLLPIDFWQKLASRKMTAQQAIMQPELNEIKQKYGNNQALMQQKQAELYKKYNASPANSCLVMILYLVVTMLVFFTLFSGLGKISRTQINYEYYTIEQTYRQTYEANQTDPNVVELSQNAAAEKYDEIKQGFITIKNIWRPDNWSSVFPKAEEFLKSTNASLRAYTYTYEPENTETSEPAKKITYIYLSTNSQVYEDTNGNKYVEPYVDLNGNVYVIYDVSATATNPATFTIKAQDGNINYSNLVYSTLFESYSNSDLGITYFYLTQNQTNTYTFEENTHIMPYIFGNTIYATAGTDTEVVINGKTYNVDYSKTEDMLITQYTTDLSTEKVQDNYAYSSAADALSTFKADFELVTKAINDKYEGQWNGYFVLIILAGAITFLSSYLTNLGVKTKDKKGNDVKASKPKPTMGIIMAFIMIFFTFSYTSAFAIYIIANSIISTILTYLSNLVLNNMELKKEQKENKVADYVRK